MMPLTPFIIAFAALVPFMVTAWAMSNMESLDWSFDDEDEDTEEDTGVALNADGTLPEDLDR